MYVYVHIQPCYLSDEYVSISEKLVSFNKLGVYVKVAKKWDFVTLRMTHLLACRQ